MTAQRRNSALKPPREPRVPTFPTGMYMRIYLILVGCCGGMLAVVIGRAAPLRVVR